MKELANNVLVFILCALIVLFTSIVPIPLARGLWVWTWWAAFSDHTALRLYGVPVRESEAGLGGHLDDFHPIEFFIPFSRFWRAVRGELLRNRVLG